jgi:hypothetical protein
LIIFARSLGRLGKSPPTWARTGILSYRKSPVASYRRSVLAANSCGSCQTICKIGWLKIPLPERRGYNVNVEEWKDVNGYEGLYQVSNQGRVRGLTRGKVLRPYRLPEGYLLVTLSRGNRLMTRKAHALVARAWLTDKPSPRHQINHKNSIPSDNRPENLEWMTCQENVTHNRVNGRKIGQQKLTEHDVRHIRIAHQFFGQTQAELARWFRVCPQNVSDIVTGKQWKHLLRKDE